MSEFEDIVPYSDEEAAAALHKIAQLPAVYVVSKYLFPTMPINTLSVLLMSVNSIDEFQRVVMSKAVSSIINMTATGVTVSGIENVDRNTKYLFISNHRDIILDPAILQWVLLRHNIPMTNICVGSNLLSNSVVEDLMRSNRMIKVIRGISARELYLSSQILSKYIRQLITSGEASVWIAQKEGRTKNGLDRTEQGLLKMFDMSGEKSFSENFEELNIIPVSISYEYESCDVKKAREIYISRRQKYIKKKNEDMHSILTGIRQEKGNIHLHFGKPLDPEVVRRAGESRANDRYLAIRQELDKQIISGYHLWKTNYIAFDLMNNSSKYADKYTDADVKEFKQYMKYKLSRVESKLYQPELQDIFLHIYGNPVVSKEELLG